MGNYKDVYINCYLELNVDDIFVFLMFYIFKSPLVWSVFLLVRFAQFFEFIYIINSETISGLLTFRARQL